MHLLSPFSLNLPLYEHKKRPSYQHIKAELICLPLSELDEPISNFITLHDPLNRTIFYHARA